MPLAAATELQRRSDIRTREDIERLAGIQNPIARQPDKMAERQGECEGKPDALTDPRIPGQAEATPPAIEEPARIVSRPRKAAAAQTAPAGPKALY